MKKTTLLIAFVVLFSSLAIAAIPQEISIHGKTRNGSGVYFTDIINMTVGIYSDYALTTSLYSSTQNISVINGTYNIVLQAVNLDFDQQYYVTIAIGEDPGTDAILNTTMAPYAHRANIADTVNDTNVIKSENTTFVTSAMEGIIGGLVNFTYSDLDNGSIIRTINTTWIDSFFGTLNLQNITLQNIADNIGNFSGDKEDMNNSLKEYTDNANTSMKTYVDTQGFLKNNTPVNFSSITVDGDILPLTTLLHDLGSPTQRWNYLYTTNVSADYVDASYGISTTTFTATSANITTTYVDNLRVITINASYIYNYYYPGVMDLRGDPWWISNVDLEIAQNLLVDMNAEVDGNLTVGERIEAVGLNVTDDVCIDGGACLSSASNTPLASDYDGGNFTVDLAGSWVSGAITNNITNANNSVLATINRYNTSTYSYLASDYYTRTEFVPINTSLKDYTDDTNTSMKTYVDATLGSYLQNDTPARFTSINISDGTNEGLIWLDGEGNIIIG